MKVVDLVSEALRSLSVRPWRTVMTSLGTMFGVAALVGVVGMASTAQRQVSDEFDLLEATEVLGTITSEVDVLDAETRLDSQPAVLAAGVYDSGGLKAVAALPIKAPALEDVNIIRATEGFYPAKELGLRWGRWFDNGHVTRGDRVVVLGSNLADRLGATGVAGPIPMVWLDGIGHTVIGIVDDSARFPIALDSLIVPFSDSPTAAETTNFTVRAELGEAGQIADSIGFVPLPGNSEAVTVVRPPEPGGYTETIRADIQSLVFAAAAISLGAGILVIANVTSVSVVERRSEMGLRLALGAKRRHITIQVALEAALVGLWGGFLGAALGVVIVVVGAGINAWSPVLPPMIVIAGPAIGLGVGVLAGVIPAYRTGLVPPDKALRTE